MPNNEDVAQTATEKGKIRLDSLSLIGVFGTETSRHALLRHPGGRVEKVRMGERVGPSKVVAISRDTVFLSSGSKTSKLELPAG